MHPLPYTLNLQPKVSIIYPAPYTLHHTTYALNAESKTRHLVEVKDGNEEDARDGGGEAFEKHPGEDLPYTLRHTLYTLYLTP